MEEKTSFMTSSAATASACPAISRPCKLTGFGGRCTCHITWPVRGSLIDDAQTTARELVRRA